MKLISMKNFVLEQVEFFKKDGSPQRINLIGNYANFLNQELNIGMFVPAVFENGKWEVLEEPKNYNQWLRRETGVPYSLNLYLYEQYQKAKENVLFEGFVFREKHIYNKDIDLLIYLKNIPKITIEDLTGCDLKLTENVIKQLGL